MGIRGPEPENKLSVIEPRQVERPKPFSNMCGAAKAVWVRIINDLPVDHFKDHELDILRAYCEAAAMNARASGELKKRDASPVIFVETQNGSVPRKNPWWDIQRESSRTMADLGLKLRLTKNSKLSNKQASGVETGKPVSRRSGLLLGGRHGE